MPVPVMVCGDDISLIINKNNLTITSFFHDNIVVTDCYLFLLAFFIYLFFRGAFNIQANNAIYVWVMRYQSLEINYHTAPNNKSTALQCMKQPVAHSPNSTWFWLELVGNSCERLKIIMKYTNIQFCERLGHVWQFHPLALPILQKLISIMVCLLGRSE